jgi:sugar lactone lactonase YvrE
MTDGYMPRRDALAAAGLILLLAALVACASTAPRGSAATPAASGVPTPTALPSYTLRVVAHGFGQPDDLTLDARGHIVFSDLANGSVARVTADGRLVVLTRGLPEPEGLVALPDGTLLIAVQGQSGQGIDAVLRLAPGSSTPDRFVAFPNPTGNPGLDGLSRDPRTGDILVADSPNGNVYRVSADGQRVSLLAAGFVRPTDAIADAAGNVYVADEYGNRVARVAPDGAVTTLARIAYTDDLAFDSDGTLLVTSLSMNALLRLDPSSGRVLATLATGLREPQGLAVDPTGNLYVSEAQANVIVELRRA